MSQAIVVAVDGTPAADRAVEWLAGYRGEPSRIHLIAVNVQPPPLTLWPKPSLDVRSVEEALVTRGLQVAASAVARLQAAGLRAEATVALGLPVEGLVREAQSRGAGLIVMGTRGHGALRGFALGSVAMRVVHASPLPVCLVRPESALPAQLGRSLRALLAVDGSDAALHAAQALVAWRPWLGELDVEVVSVQQPLTYVEAVMPPHDDVTRQWGREAGEAAARPVLDLLAGAGIAHRLHLSLGDPAGEIVRLAGETGCELVALGTRGLGAAHHAFIGSVALKVAAHVAVPAVLVK
jgi:nucleotide-binding universal stress UspA family protein